MFSTSKEMTLFSERKLFRSDFPQHVWYFSGKSLMGETMCRAREKNELETHDRSNLKAFFDNLAFQQYKTINKMIDFPINYSSMGVKFSTEWFWEENKTVVTEKTESQYQKKKQILQNPRLFWTTRNFRLFSEWLINQRKPPL